MSATESNDLNPASRAHWSVGGGSRLFPIMAEYDRENRRDYPATTIPWAMIEPHEAQASKNHCGQTLERLAMRGGLSRAEAVAVLRDVPWRRAQIIEADDALTEMVAVFHANTPVRDEAKPRSL